MSYETFADVAHHLPRVQTPMRSTTAAVHRSLGYLSPNIRGPQPPAYGQISGLMPVPPESDPHTRLRGSIFHAGSHRRNNTSLRRGKSKRRVHALQCRHELSASRRVGVWRSGFRFERCPFAAPFVWRCLSGSAVALFPHSPHRTGQAGFLHPALGQDLTPSSTELSPIFGDGLEAQAAAVWD